jgi:DNA-binding PadR family transcriptional regulator
MRILVLEVLADGPKRGYEVIKAIRDRFHGLYSPSPGAIYPTLQLLEDEGMVEVEVVDGKKLYEITEEGRRFLNERRDQLEALLEKGRKMMGAEAAELMIAARSRALTVFHAYATLPPERLLEVAEVLREAWVKVLRVMGKG